jgi:phenylalanyl-tRNA synthetase beta chain
MKVSLNWVRFLNDKYHCAAEPAPDGIGALAEKIGLQLGAVEEVIDLGKKYSGVVVVKVVSCVKHPNADKLSICLVDDAKFAKNVARNNEGYVEIVCGAANVKAGQLVAWIPPGSIVPSTFDKDPFIIEKREIRGATSNGMIASAKELGLGEDHSGILVIDEDIKPGTPLASAFGLDDYIIDIENKMFTHRPKIRS